MKLRLLSSLIFLLAFSELGHAENSIGISGNYYKERSTRVIEPLIRISRDLPNKSEVEITYLVDQITSASGAFTNTDVAFSEFRNEIRVAGRMKLWDVLTAGISGRYSHEPDYQSVGAGLNAALDLFKKSTVISSFIQLVGDDISDRYNPNNTDELSTTAFGVGVTQILRKDLIAGLNLETQIDTGMQENQYRVETHPRCRNRYSASLWARYRVRPTKTTLRTSYRYYRDSWKVKGHTTEFEFNQQLAEGLEIVPRIRHHTQWGVFFEFRDDGSGHEEIRECHLENEAMRGGRQQPVVRFSTMDPKMTTFNAQTYGLQLRFQQRWLADTGLKFLSTAWIEPAYYYFDQKNRYGPAHIAQLNFYWPY